VFITTDLLHLKYVLWEKMCVYIKPIYKIYAQICKNLSCTIAQNVNF